MEGKIAVIDGRLNHVAGLELLKNEFRLIDRVRHDHGVHPAVDLFIRHADGLVGSVHGLDFAPEDVAFLGRCLGGVLGKPNDRQSQHKAHDEAKDPLRHI